MALVKTSQLAGRTSQHSPLDKPTADEAQPNPVRRRSQERSRARQQLAAERIGAATEELASGVAQASAAAEELRRAIEQIASAAEEAAGASQQSLVAIAQLSASFTQARDNAGLSRRRTESLQALLSETAAQMDASVAALQANAARQGRSVELISVLERHASDIGEITRAVGEVSDQTNLLALNAAIEAARAGDEGRGFAIVADEVRALAAVSERSAADVQDLAGSIANEVRSIAERIRTGADRAIADAGSGRSIIASLDTIREEIAALSEGSQAVLLAAIEAETAAREAQRGAEQIAGAAEEQSAAATEAQRVVQQQSESLDQSRKTAESLAVLADALQSNSAGATTAEQVGAAAEELSAVIQELSGGAGQIMTAVEQISRGAQAQAAATQQSNTAMSQIEKVAGASLDRGTAASVQIEAIAASLSQSRTTIGELSRRSQDALVESRAVVGMTESLETAGRRIEKIVDGLSLVAVQTSMLAVSGAIEAARAGEAGRGFATVSADIRALARDSSDSAERIKEVVRSVRDQVAVVRRDLDQIVAVTESEAAKNALLTEKLGQVDSDLEGVRSANAEILAGTEAILASVRDVQSGTQQVAAVAEQAGSAAAQAAAASRQQARGAEDLAAAIEEIASLADELQVAEA